MKIHLFIILPEEIDFTAKKDVVGELTKTINNVKKSATLYYCPSNFGTFFTKAAEIFEAFKEEYYMTNPKNALQHIMNKSVISINDAHKRSGEYCYIQYTLDPFEIEYTNNDILAELTEYKLVQEEQEEIILFDFGKILKLDKKRKDCIFTFKDAHRELPSRIVSTIVVSSDVDLADTIANIATKYAKGTIDLKDKTRFIDTGKIYTPSKQRIYQEIKTGYYWYFDRFHEKTKITYEVFRSPKDYLGEHDKYGHFIERKEDRNIAEYL